MSLSDFGFLFLHLEFFLHLAAVANKLARWRKFTQTMSDHIFSGKNRNMFYCRTIHFESYRANCVNSSAWAASSAYGKGGLACPELFNGGGKLDAGERLIKPF